MSFIVHLEQNSKKGAPRRIKIFLGFGIEHSRSKVELSSEGMVKKILELFKIGSFKPYNTALNSWMDINKVRKTILSDHITYGELVGYFTYL